jgi:hypothetical protein
MMLLSNSDYLASKERMICELQNTFSSLVYNFSKNPPPFVSSGHREDLLLCKISRSFSPKRELKKAVSNPSTLSLTPSWFSTN